MRIALCVSVVADDVGTRVVIETQRDGVVVDPWEIGREPFHAMANLAAAALRKALLDLSLDS